MFRFPLIRSNSHYDGCSPSLKVEYCLTLYYLSFYPSGIPLLLKKWNILRLFRRMLCSRRYFGLARNLIRRIISPNQDDVSYSIRISFPSSRNWVNCQTQSLWLNNAGQCRRLPGRSSIAAAASTHEGTYLIYGLSASISDQGIPVEYELDTFYAITRTTSRHPQNWLCRCDALFSALGT